MAKPLFKNYNYSFQRHELKLLQNFCKTVVKQMSADEKFFQEVRTFTSLLDKLQSGEPEIKLTRDEKTKLAFRLKENRDNMKKEISKGFFIRRWIYKSAYNQFVNIINNHFND